jgi:hypothetical protein
MADAPIEFKFRKAPKNSNEYINAKFGELMLGVIYINENNQFAANYHITKPYNSEGWYNTKQLQSKLEWKNDPLYDINCYIGVVVLEVKKGQKVDFDTFNMKAEEIGIKMGTLWREMLNR